LGQVVIGQNIKPYLQSAEPTSIWVSWKTDNATNPSVDYGLTSNNLSNTATGTTKDLEPQDTGYNTPYHWHTVKLTGLTPNTGYYYRVQSGTTDESDIHYFKTPPALGNNNDKLRFIMLGDHQNLTYQGQPYFKFNELVQAAKSKVEELYGTPISDHINLIINDGDQVDLGNLDQYENIHFAKQNYITPNLPLITAIGNHELYGTMGLDAYYEHFILNDNLTYNGIDSGTERYYAYQMANVLFLVLDSELNGTTQLSWANTVINEANNDSDVDWIISISHKPYQAEQYSNDYSQWYGTSVLPFLQATDKFALHIAGHHHMYARGQFKDIPAYHMISGGTAWPQYWGDSGNEVDLDETQESWSNFAYQIIEIDNVTNEMTVQSYSIGSLTTTKNNVLLDEFHLKRGQSSPDTPSITNAISAPITLPYTFNSSNFSSASTEAYNSTQFQISSTSDFSIIEEDEFRHYENYYGPLGNQTDETENIGEGPGIFNLNIASNQLNNGAHYIRVRHRDQSLYWSDWSSAIQFDVTGSVDGTPTISTDKNSYAVNETINVQYTNGPGNNLDWIGIYEQGENPGDEAATVWTYINGSVSGIVNFTVPTSGQYFVAFFENDGYTELGNRVNFWVGDTPTLSTDNTEYAEGEDVIISYTNAPNNAQDWIGIYKVGEELSASGTSASWQYVNSNSGSFTFSNLPKGYYKGYYLLTDGYFSIGNEVFFQVGTQITSIITDKTTYGLDEPITISFVDGPGKEKDWIGIYNSDDDPNIDPLLTYKYFDGLANGTTTISETEGTSGQPNQLPDVTGNYFLVMFIDDSYEEVSNRVYFDVVNTLSIEDVDKPGHNVTIYPNPLNEQTAIDSKFPISKYELFDATGKKVFESNTNGLQTNKIKLEHQFLNSGIYILRVHADKVYHLKLVVK
ncbi:fibronectin type III domain-containing protein, partial [Polaribacter sp.]|nr:fibronectin type III domain-containing protein [Polaribacter sp.]